MRQFLPAMLFIAACCCFFSVSSAAANSTSANRVRAQRKEIDEAFQQHDPKRLATLFTSDCHFTSAAIHTDGGDALEHLYATLFQKRPDITLEHHPDRIAVNETWDVASEEGKWVERWKEKDGVTELRGTYLALWKRQNGRWRESDEILVPETCTGSSYCH